MLGEERRATQKELLSWSGSGSSAVGRFCLCCALALSRSSFPRQEQYYFGVTGTLACFRSRRVSNLLAGTRATAKRTSTYLSY